MSARGGLSETGARGSLNENPKSFSLNTYPNSFFDLSSQDIPRTVKEMFHWCLYLYSSHSEIRALIDRKVSYIVTDLVYDTEVVRVREMWEELLEEVIDIQRVKKKLATDLEVYGNAFCSILYPFERWLICTTCNEKIKITDKKLQWHYRDHTFTGKCPKCGDAKSPSQFQKFDVLDKPIKQRKNVKLTVWFPQYMRIEKNEITEKTNYYYEIPRHIVRGVKNAENDENKYLVEDMPMGILTAIKEGKSFRLDKNALFHMKGNEVSYYDSNFAMPPLVSVFKDAWLFQTYRRAQEAIAMEHVVPLRLLIPRPISGDHSPHMHNDLGQWSFRMQAIAHRWRRDPNAFFTVPFPCEVQNIGGDAQALNVHNDMEQIRQHIGGGLGIPSDLLYGGGSWSGTSVSLRMLESLWLNSSKSLDKFVNKFVVSRLAAWLNLPVIEIKQRDFKMLDDSQQKQLAVTLRQTNTISDRTVIQELGFDYAEEQERKKQEEDDRNQTLTRQMVAQANAQGQAQIVTSRLEAEAQLAQQAAMEKGQKRQQLEQYDELTEPKSRSEMAQIADAVKGPNPAVTGGSSIKMSSKILDTLAESVMSSTPPDMMEDTIIQAKQKNPLLAHAIQKRMSSMKDLQKQVKPLPDQKPPRRK